MATQAAAVQSAAGTPSCGRRLPAHLRAQHAQKWPAAARQRAGVLPRRQACRFAAAVAAAAEAAEAPAAVRPEGDVANLSAFLDGLKWDSSGLVVAIAQHVDTGEVLMQAFADRAAVCETLQTGCARSLAAAVGCAYACPVW